MLSPIKGTIPEFAVYRSTSSTSTTHTSAARRVSTSGDDGEWNIIDGQQRAAAAKYRGDIQSMPALVHENLQTKDEAQVFLGLQNRVGLTSIDVFRAKLITSDPVAIHINAVCSSLGIAVQSGTRPGGRRISCITDMTRMCERNQAVFDCAMKTATLILFDLGMTCSGRLLAGLFFIEEAARSALSDFSILEKRFVVGLAEIGSNRLSEDIDKRVVGLQDNTRAVYAAAILQSFNHGRRKRVVQGINS